METAFPTDFASRSPQPRLRPNSNDCKSSRVYRKSGECKLSVRSFPTCGGRCVSGFERRVFNDSAEGVADESQQAPSAEGVADESQQAPSAEGVADESQQ